MFCEMMSSQSQSDVSSLNLGTKLASSQKLINLLEAAAHLLQ